MIPTFRSLFLEDFFSLGAMSGGWDDAAWAAKGLPASGELVFTLTITSVNDQSVSASDAPAA